MSDDVVIIGIGCLLPQGEGEAALDRVLAGHSAARRWAMDPRYVVGQVSDELVPLCGEEDRATAMAVRAAESALADAGLISPRGFGRIPPERRACLFSLSKGALDVLGRAVEQGGDWVLAADPAAAARRMAARWDLAGPTLAVVSACATGGFVLSRARSLLAEGRADVVLCGAADASIRPLILGSYRKLGLLAPTDRKPEEVCRPFSADRAGFYVGEGAAALVLCRRSTVETLGVAAKACLASCAEGAFATDLTTVPTDGRDLARIIAQALGRAGLTPQDVDLAALHGTATRDGDANEAVAMQLVFGSRASQVACLATKWLHGHLLGAASAVETVLAIRALVTRRVPPVSGNQCDGNMLGDDRGRPQEVKCGRVAVKLSAGFGGQVSVCVLRSG